MNPRVRFVYDDGNDLALLLARGPQGWQGMRAVPFMIGLSLRHTPVADAIITARWDVQQTWTGQRMAQHSSYLRSVLALA